MKLNILKLLFGIIFLIFLSYNTLAGPTFDLTYTISTDVYLGGNPFLINLKSSSLLSSLNDSGNLVFTTNSTFGGIKTVYSPVNNSLLSNYFIWEPFWEEPGNYPIWINVSDDNSSDVREIIVQLNEGNSPNGLFAIVNSSNLTVMAGSTINLLNLWKIRNFTQGEFNESICTYSTINVTDSNWTCPFNHTNWVWNIPQDGEGFYTIFLNYKWNDGTKIGDTKFRGNHITIFVTPYVAPPEQIVESSGGGGGGGGSSFTPSIDFSTASIETTSSESAPTETLTLDDGTKVKSTEVITIKNQEEGDSIQIRYSNSNRFQEHTVDIFKVNKEEQWVRLFVRSEVTDLTIKVGETVRVDADKNGFGELLITLVGMDKGKINLNFREVLEEVIETPKIEEPIKEVIEEIDIPLINGDAIIETPNNNFKIGIIALIIFSCIIFSIFIFKKRSNKKR